MSLKDSKEKDYGLKDLRDYAKETEELFEQGFFANLITIPDYPAKSGIIRVSITHFAMQRFLYDDGRWPERTDEECEQVMMQCDADILNPQLPLEEVYNKYFKGLNDERRQTMMEMMAMVRETFAKKK